MKRLTPRQWAQALYALTETTKTSAETETKIQQFVSLLRRRRALPLVGHIARLYRERADATAGIVRVKTVAARALSKETTQELKSLGTEVIIDHTIDPHVIGGMKIEMDGVIIDGTVATRLHKLYES